VDGKNGSRLTKKRIVSIQTLQVNGQQTGLPIMAVNNIGSELDPFAQLKDSSAEEDESLRVVKVISF